MTDFSLENMPPADRALVVGIGGGGDVVGAVATARFLEDRGVDTLLGGLPWERPVLDPTPGPFPLDRIEGLERVSDTVGLADGETRSEDGIAFAECRVAAHRGERVALLDITRGPEVLASGLEAASDTLGFDLVIGVDAGGDALARGGEPGIRSPLADAISVAALDATAIPSAVGVFGWGSDGELTPAELDASLAEVAVDGGLLGAWGLTPETCAELEELSEIVPTEASRLPVEAARGELGERSIRDGARSLNLTAASTVTFYLDTAAVAAVSDPVKRVRAVEDLEAAHESLRSAGYVTELAIERGEVE